MIRRLQGKHYRCLRYVDLRLERFHLLVGPNASGKSTVLDALGFLGDLVSSGLDAAVARRTPDFRDLVWGRPGNDLGELGFELAVECDAEDHDDRESPPPADRVFRYEVAIRAKEGAPYLAAERGLLGPVGAVDFGRRRSRFPDPQPPPRTIFVDAAAGGYRTVLSRGGAGSLRFEPESQERVAEPWEAPSSGSGRTILASLPDAPDDFPAAFCLRRWLTGMRRSFLDPAALRRPAPPTPDARTLSPDGSNLPWVARHLQSEAPERFRDWLSQVRSALEDVAEVRVTVREADERAWLVVRYRNGVEAPSWAVSDGTLRLLGHTLRFYSTLPRTLTLIEEPEAGVHPHEMQEVLTALPPVAGCQVLVSTQSPAILTDAEAQEVLCCATDEEGDPEVIPVLSHPLLEDWIGSPPLGTVLGSGMLSGRPATPASLVVVVPDSMIRAVVETLLRERRKDLGIREMTFEMFRHPQADPGCRMRPSEEVRGRIRTAERVLVLFDYDGCGSSEPPAAVAAEVEADLERNGWRGRCRAIVIVPELENWIWGRPEDTARTLGWKAGSAALRDRLADHGLWPPGEPKPPDPKRAAEKILERKRKNLTTAFYRDLARTADFRGCRDPAFLALRDTLREWYPVGGESPGEPPGASSAAAPHESPPESPPES